jgi:hypothetical protein
VNSCTSPPRAILTAARVGRYDHITPIYIPPYAVPPTTLILGSRIPGLQGSQGSRVTGLYHGGYHITGSPILGSRVRDPGLPGSQGHWVIGSITRVFSMVRVSMVTMVLGHGSPWVTITRITGSQGYRVTGHHGHRVTITMVTGLPSPWFRVTYNHGLTT